jgi:hypothetical protein
MNSYSVTIRAVSQQTFTILAEDETEASHLAHEQFDPDPSVVEDYYVETVRVERID